MVVATGTVSAAAYGILSVISQRQHPLPFWIFAGIFALTTILWAGTYLALGQSILSRRSLGAILFFAVAFRIAGLFGAPIYEDDYFRYLWDGRMFATTGSPYLTPPSAAFGDDTLPPAFDQILGRINNPEIPTIYGPFCELIFLAGYWIAPGELWPLKLLFLLADLGVLWLLWRMLGPSRALLIYAWCPLLIKEVAFTPHTDILATFFLVLAFERANHWRGSASAAALAAAVVSRLLAGIFVPLLLWRSRRAWLIFFAAIAASYAPFLIHGGAGAGSMSTFASQWEFNSFVFGLLKPVAGEDIARIICFCAFPIFYVWMWKKRRDLLDPAILLGVFFLLSPVVNPWYLVMLVPFVALRPTAWGIAAIATILISYATAGNLGISGMGLYDHPIWVRPLELLPVIAAAIWERRIKPGLASPDRGALYPPPMSASLQTGLATESQRALE